MWKAVMGTWNCSSATTVFTVNLLNGNRQSKQGGGKAFEFDPQNACGVGQAKCLERDPVQFVHAD